MSDAIVIPGPDPDWGTAFDTQGHGGNPASQGFVWDAARLVNREIAVLAASFDAVTARLRLVAEHVQEDLGEVDAATFLIGGVWYTISRFRGDDSNGLHVAVENTALVEDDEALDGLLGALGVAPEVVGCRRDGDDFFVHDDPTPLHRFAARIRLALVAAGLPIVPNRSSARQLAGARIDLDPDDGPNGSVAVFWQAHHKLRTDPPNGAYHLAQLAMADAIATILTAAGFTTVARAGRLLLRQGVEEVGRHGDGLRLGAVPRDEFGPAGVAEPA